MCPPGELYRRPEAALIHFGANRLRMIIYRFSKTPRVVRVSSRYCGESRFVTKPNRQVEKIGQVSVTDREATADDRESLC